MGQNASQTGFTSSSTGEQVTANEDLTGKWALITGCSDGIGLETARVLHKCKCNLVMACRDVEKMGKAVKQIQIHDHVKIEQVQVDLAKMDSIKQAVAQFKLLNLKLDFLICNAGMTAGSLRLSELGVEMTFATNHLGHFALVVPLMEYLQPSARVLVVSSDLHTQGNVKWLDDIAYKQQSFGTGMQAYADSKLANVLFANELARRIAQAGKTIAVVSLTPGLVKTQIMRESPILDSLNHILAYPFLKSIEQGAATTLYCVVGKQVANGSYYADCNPKECAPAANDEELMKKLWQYSEQITGVTYK